MTQSQTIESLIQRGVANLSIGPLPDRSGRFFVRAVQAVATGEEGCHNENAIQTHADSIAECLSTISETVDHNNQLKKEPTIIRAKLN